MALLMRSRYREELHPHPMHWRYFKAAQSSRRVRDVWNTVSQLCIHGYSSVFSGSEHPSGREVMNGTELTRTVSTMRISVHNERIHQTRFGSSILSWNTNDIKY